MKLEIDFSNPELLRRTKRQLEAALQAVNVAISAFDTTGPDLQALNSLAGELDSSVISVVNSLPMEFNMREAREAAERLQIPEWRLRRGLENMVESHLLRVSEQGQGRRPTTYRKD